VARVSVGSAIAEAAYGVVRRATEELLATGPGGALDHGEVHRPLAGRRSPAAGRTGDASG
jgi:hypothetical protein